MTDELLISQEGAVVTLTINRPDRRNALTPSCMRQMMTVLRELAETKQARPVIIRGAGDHAFSSGFDMAVLPSDITPEEEAELRNKAPMDHIAEAIQAYPFPVIAMLNGYAIGGGCELAIACDIRVAAEQVRMSMPPAKLGLVYSYNGYRRFLNVLGLTRTLELFLVGRHYDSRQCLQMGLVNYVQPKENLEAFTYELAQEISENAPLSLQGTKYTLYKITQHPALDPVEEEKIRSLFTRSLQSEDLAEGVRAFKEKRKPRFIGR